MKIGTQPSGPADFYLLGGMLPVDIVEDISFYRFSLGVDAFDFISSIPFSIRYGFTPAVFRFNSGSLNLGNILRVIAWRAYEFDGSRCASHNDCNGDHCRRDNGGTECPGNIST